MDKVSIITNAITKAQNESIGREEIFKDDSVGGKNEFLFFIKPELTLPSGSIRLEPILEMIFSKLEAYKLQIKNILILPASYLHAHNIIAQHYGVINAISRNARKALNEGAKEKFKSLFGKSVEESNILGGLEFANKYPLLSPTAIDYIWQNAKAEKLGGGAYVGKISLDGEETYLVNGFHPRQLEHFIAKGRSIVAMTLCGNTSWTDARNKLIGKTNPHDAEGGSIRRTLLEKKEVYGLSAVSPSWNGVHLSAGPVEGLVELLRYNTDFENGSKLNATSFQFGRQLKELLNDDHIKFLLNNPEVNYKGKTESIFDLTEEMDSDEALKVIAGLDLK